MPVLPCRGSNVLRPVVKKTPSRTSSYDVEAWRYENYTKRLAEYRFPERQVFGTQIDVEVKQKLQLRLETFGEHPGSLGKLTRTLFARELRRSLVEPALPQESLK